MMALFSILFAATSSHVVPTAANLLVETGLSLAWHSQLSIFLFGSWDGWSSWLVTLSLLLLNRILGKVWPQRRETINDGFSFLFLIVFPLFLAFSLFPTMALLNKL